MAKVYALSFHSGGKLHELEAQTPAQIASEWDLSLEEVKVFVNDGEAAVTQALRQRHCLFSKGQSSFGLLTPGPQLNTGAVFIIALVLN